jgi:hypothetical protein
MTIIFIQSLFLTIKNLKIQFFHVFTLNIFIIVDQIFSNIFFINNYVTNLYKGILIRVYLHKANAFVFISCKYPNSFLYKIF